MNQTLYDTADNTIETPTRFVIWGMNKLFGWRWSSDCAIKKTSKKGF